MFFMTGRAIHPFGINDADQIVGAILNDGVAHADLTVNGSRLDTNGADLNDRLDPQGGWVFNVATDINNRGEIVGYATDARAGSMPSSSRLCRCPSQPSRRPWRPGRSSSWPVA